jgi:hypothetical protein
MKSASAAEPGNLTFHRTYNLTKRRHCTSKLTHTHFTIKNSYFPTPEI